MAKPGFWVPGIVEKGIHPMSYKFRNVMPAKQPGTNTCIIYLSSKIGDNRRELYKDQYNRQIPARLLLSVKSVGLRDYTHIYATGVGRQAPRSDNRCIMMLLVILSQFRR